MTEKPYTDADVELAHRAFDAAWSTHNETHPERHCAALDMAEEECCDRAGLVAALDALAAAGRLAHVDDDLRHIIQFRTDGWTIKHPLACRIGDLFGCRVNFAAEGLAGPPVPPGRYEASVSDIDGRLQIGDRVDQEATPPADDPADAEADQAAVQDMLDDATRAFAEAGTSSERVEVVRDLLAGWYAAWPATAVTDEHEGIAHQIAALVYAAEARAAACPCLLGAPKHRHGVGGYSTSGERAAEAHHVIAFAGDGTWSLEHPATCPPGDDASATDWDCPLRQLAERQIPSDLAALMAGGRYTCHAGDVGDLFQLGERLHDDQCTQPLCAACGCWCHAEEQTGR